MGVYFGEVKPDVGFGENVEPRETCSEVINDMVGEDSPIVCSLMKLVAL